MKKKKRVTRNVLMTLIIILLGVGMFFTVQAQTQSNIPQMPGSSQGDMQSPPQLQNGESANGASDFENSEQSTPPEKPSGDGSSDENGNSAPPEKPSDNASSENGASAEASGSDEAQSGSTSSSTSSDAAASDESSNKAGSDASSEKPEMSGEAMPDMDKNFDKTSGEQLIYFILFGAQALGISALAVYLILSHFNKFRVKKTLENGKKVAAFALSVILITGIATAADVYAVTSTPQNGGSPMQMQSADNSAASAEAFGATEITDDQTLSASYSSSTADENAVLVKDGASATLDGAEINKTSGDSSNTENSEFYGINSALLVTENSTATVKNSTINTAAKGANAVFATGENAKIYISDSTVTSTASGSARGLDATYGGYIEADNVTVKTSGSSCAALATDRGEGTVKATDCSLSTSGKGSPIIYSTGDISISNTTGKASGSQAVVIEGKNSATVTGSTLTADASGNRGDEDGGVDKCGVFIYQSMSGDADEGTGTFTASDSTIEIDENSAYYKSAPMFFVTNTNAKINLENVKLKFASGVLLNAAATDEWGNSGSNGGNVTLSATNQSLTGDICADSISAVSVTLKSSSYKGAINSENSAKEITLTLDENSTLTLTGDSYVTSLSDADGTYSNIDFNGYTLYVDGKALS